MDEYYKILGVSEDVSDLELIKAYKILVKKYHPDNNIGNDTTEVFVKIQNAYTEIVDYRMKYGNSNLGFENSNREDFFKSFNEYKMAQDAYNELMNYINSNYDLIPKRNLFGKFGHGKIFLNEPIEESELEFIDGYAQIVTGLSDCSYEFGMGLFGPTDALHYNYINKNGEFLFDHSEELVFVYLGRNIFLHIYADGVYYLCSPNKQKKFIKIKKGEYSVIVDTKKFIDIVIEELNRKYTMEAKGLSYIPTPKSRDEWTLKSKYGGKSYLKKMVLRFVEEISEYDDMTRDMYYLQALEDNSLSNEEEKGIFKKLLKRRKRV